MRKGKIVNCLGCNKDKALYARKMCIGCYTKQRNKIYKERQKVKYKEKYDDMETFYKKFWDGQKDKRCFECGSALFNYKNWHVHHIPIKRKYPELSHNEDVCVLMCLECHSGWHSGAPSSLEEKYPNTYKRFLELKEKYNIKLYN